MTGDDERYYPDQLVVTVDGNIRLDSDNDEIAAGSAIQVCVEREDYQDKSNEFLNRIQSAGVRAQYRQLVIGYSNLPHGRTETMDRSCLMERFIKFLEESQRDAGQLRGPSDAMFKYVQGIIQNSEATMESVLQVLDEWWKKMIAHAWPLLADVWRVEYTSWFSALAWQSWSKSGFQGAPKGLNRLGDSKVGNLQRASM